MAEPIKTWQEELAALLRALTELAQAATEQVKRQ